MVKRIYNLKKKNHKSSFLILCRAVCKSKKFVHFSIWTNTQSKTHEKVIKIAPIDPFDVHTCSLYLWLLLSLLLLILFQRTLCLNLFSLSSGAESVSCLSCICIVKLGDKQSCYTGLLPFIFFLFFLQELLHTKNKTETVVNVSLIINIICLKCKQKLYLHV